MSPTGVGRARGKRWQHACGALPMCVALLLSAANSLKASPALVGSMGDKSESSWRMVVGPAADLDRDSDVDLHDFALLQRYATNSSRPMAVRLRECGDLNRDGRVDIGDLLVFEQATGLLGGDVVAAGDGLPEAVLAELAAVVPTLTTRSFSLAGQPRVSETLGRLPDQPWEIRAIGELHLAVDLRLSGTDPPLLAAN